MADRVDIELHSEELDRLLDRLERNLKRPVQAMRRIGNYLQNVTEEAFETQSSPGGDPWTPLSQRTVTGKIQRHGDERKMLWDEGTTQRSLTYDADNEGVAIGVNAYSADGYPYPIVQQFGTEDGVIEARPFLPIDPDGNLDEDVENEVVEILKEVLLEG